MTHPAQAAHRLTYGYMAITPVNGMSLASKWEPGKRAGRLLICRIHRRRTPKPALSDMDGTQGRGMPSQKAWVWGTARRGGFTAQVGRIGAPTWQA